MRIFDTLNSKPQRPGFGDKFPPAAGVRFVYRAEAIATEPYVIPPWKRGTKVVYVSFVEIGR